MKYDKIKNNLFVENRNKFIQHLQPNSIAIFNSNDIITTGADSTFPFEQNKDIFYLSGIDQEESILLLFPDYSQENMREILFLKETSERIKIWEGEKYDKESAFTTSGIKTVYWLQDFNAVFNTLMYEAKNVYINKNIHTRANTEAETREDRFINWCKSKYNAHHYMQSSQILHKLRSIKNPIEIEIMQIACNITEKGFRRVLEYIEPGIMEYNIEAELMHEFLNNKSRGFAYTPIIASGYNSCVLHYIQNNRECKDGDILLLDVGAEYAYYRSDMTRCIPVNGKFSNRQKEVYNSVLNVKKEAEKMIIPGTTFEEYNREIGKIMTSELIKLKLLDTTDVKNQNPEFPAYKKYFMHGTSHFIGLDTHDYGNFNIAMHTGNVFTCEPGIYIPNENIGIRIEDDLLVTDNGIPFNLMKNIPIEVEEIEDLMNK